MKIYGIQKLSLVDWPGRAVATLFTGGCNFDCPFCQNASLVENLPHPYTEEEIFSYLEARKKLLDGVCISGGEPLMHRDIASFIERVRALGYAVKLDTNGSFPSRLEELVASGLIDYVAMDIKNTPEKYRLTAGCDVDTEAVFRSADMLIASGIDHEFRTTVSETYHTPEDIEKIAERLKGSEKYFLQPFRMSEAVRDREITEPGDAFLSLCLDKASKFIKGAAIRGR